VLYLGQQHEHRTGNELHEHLHDYVWNEFDCKHDSGKLHEHVLCQHGYESFNDRHVPRCGSDGRHGCGYDGHECSPEPDHEPNGSASTLYERLNLVQQHERYESHVRPVEHKQIEGPEDLPEELHARQATLLLHFPNNHGHPAIPQ